MIKYDFGCGHAKRDGCIGIDSDPFCSADIIADITKPVPGVITQTADFVCSSHVLEHINHPFHYDAMIEMLRCLKIGGKFEFVVPHPGNDSAMVPDHRHAFSVRYFNDMKDNPLPGMVIDSIEVNRTDFFNKVKKATKLDDEIITSCFRNVAHEIVVRGTKTGEGKGEWAENAGYNEPEVVVSGTETPEVKIVWLEKVSLTRKLIRMVLARLPVLQGIRNRLRHIIS